MHMQMAMRMGAEHADLMCGSQSTFANRAAAEWRMCKACTVPRLIKFLRPFHSTFVLTCEAHAARDHHGEHIGRMSLKAARAIRHFPMQALGMLRIGQGSDAGSRDVAHGATVHTFNRSISILSCSKLCMSERSVETGYVTLRSAARAEAG